MTFLLFLLDFFAIFVVKGTQMTYAEYLIKCESVVKVLVKIVRGEYISPEERFKAFKDAVELFDYENNARHNEIR